MAERRRTRGWKTGAGRRSYRGRSVMRSIATGQARELKRSMGRWHYFRRYFAGNIQLTPGGNAGFELAIANGIQGADPITLYLLESVLMISQNLSSSGSQGRIVGAIATKKLRHGQVPSDIPQILNAPAADANEMPLGHWRLFEWRNALVSDQYGDRTWTMPISHRKDLKLLEGEQLVIKATLDTFSTGTFQLPLRGLWVGRYRYLQSGASASIDHEQLMQARVIGEVP